MTISEQQTETHSEDTNIWSSILEQVHKTDTKKLPSDKTLLVLGDNETGKTSLVAKLAGVETPMKGAGLEYNFIEIRDEYREESTKLGAWILDGDLKHVNLLKFALTEPNFEDSCGMLVASMDAPWRIMNSLEKWASVLEQHIQSLNIKPQKMKQREQKLVFKFLNYVSPNDEAESKLVYGNKTADSSGLLNETEMLKSGLEDGSSNQAQGSYLRSGALKKQLGIPLVVVITKTDQMAALEKDLDYTEEMFDFIQQAIRKFCLAYGASLFYVSTKTNTNCDLLHKYLAHIIYDLPFKTPASVIAKDAIFVPAGWDNMKKISILYDNVTSVNPDDDYNEFILEPNNPQPASREVEVIAEDDQSFLCRMQCDIGKQQQPASNSLAGPNAASPVQTRQNVAPAVDGQPPSEGVLQNFFNSLLHNPRLNTSNRSQ